MADNDYIRLRSPGDFLETAIHTYVHPDSGRRATLVGVMHIGPDTYYAGLREVIEKQEAAGAVVHYENTRKPSATEYAAADADEQDLVDEAHLAAQVVRKKVPDVFGWLHQRDGLRRQDTWQNIDVSLLDVIRLAGHDEFARRTRGSVQQFDWPEHDLEAPRMFRRQFAIGMRQVAGPFQHRAAGEDAHPIMVHHRTNVALQGLHATTQDVVLVWGGVHLPKMEENLQGHGYLHDSTTWHTVGQLPAEEQPPG